MGAELELLADAAEGLSYSHRSMFGGEGFFAPNGQMFAAELKGEVALRIPDEAMNAQLAARGGKPFNPLGRMPKGMTNWLVVPPDVLDEPTQLQEWVRRAHALSTMKPTKAKRAVAKADARKAKPKKAVARAKAARTPAKAAKKVVKRKR